MTFKKYQAKNIEENFFFGILVTTEYHNEINRIRSRIH
jgi:hypothetical protein